MKSTNDRHLVRRIIIALHRDLGYLFAGIVIIYALSGILMNHRKTINPNYSVEIINMDLPAYFPEEKSMINDEVISRLSDDIDQGGKIIKYFYRNGNLKILYKGGSSVVIDQQKRQATYEHVSRRPLLSDMVRLHYNPGSWWSIFSDIFAVCLLIITVTGLVIIKGRKGFIGRGGILFFLGLTIPILFLLLS